MLHLSTLNFDVSLSWSRQWWLSSIVSGWIFVDLRSRRTQGVSHVSDLKHKAWNNNLSLKSPEFLCYFLQVWPRPLISAPPPRCHGGTAHRRLCSESVWCCFTGCCCITAASLRAAGRCCTCTTRWSLLYETRWEGSPSWARAKVHTHTQVFTSAKLTLETFNKNETRNTYLT